MILTWSHAFFHRLNSEVEIIPVVGVRQCNGGERLSLSGAQYGCFYCGVIL